MIEKNFDAWNLQKKSIDQDMRKIVFNEGDIWWCSLGLNIGEEAYGKGDKFRRPILVIKKLSATTCVCIPMTSKIRTGSWYHMLNIAGMDQYFMLHQIRYMSTKRFGARMHTISRGELREIKKAIDVLYRFSE